MEQGDGASYYIGGEKLQALGVWINPKANQESLIISNSGRVYSGVFDQREQKILNPNFIGNLDRKDFSRKLDRYVAHNYPKSENKKSQVICFIQATSSDGCGHVGNKKPADQSAQVDQSVVKSRPVSLR